MRRKVTRPRLTNPCEVPKREGADGGEESLHSNDYTDISTPSEITVPKALGTENEPDQGLNSEFTTVL